MNGWAGHVPMSKANWQRRQALQIAAMLPDDPEDALQVLAFARVLVERYLEAGDSGIATGDHAVLDFPDTEASSKRRTKSKVIPSNRPR